MLANHGFEMCGCCFQMVMFLDCDRLCTLLLQLLLKLAYSLCICKKYIFLFHYLRFVHGQVNDLLVFRSLVIWQLISMVIPYNQNISEGY